MLDAVPPATSASRPGATPRARRRSFVRALAVPALLGVVAATAACAPRIGVPVADDAQNPLCADVVLALPESLGEGLDAVGTTSQATAAWGEPGAAVTLRCGVEVPGPTTTACQSVQSEGGTVDWLVVEDQGTWTFTTYGRDPAVQLVVPPAVTEDRSTAFVADLGRAVMEVPQTRACVGAGDLG
ncbi:DUF3515 domain-containing protein [Cellulosimicrobium protaetiae]|uniref:DUF3515 domain-containing protein n=1 Tax=Cellulosimicrobium protaetiae TaxID=2587808 RepID=UPI00300DABE3